MADQTPLDRAHAAMEAAPEDDAVRLRFFERLADCELFLLLSREAEGEDIAPKVFDLEGGAFVLVFDREERLADFVGETAPYAALSGRLIAGMLAGQGIGMGVNLGVAPSSILIPAEAIGWLADTLGQRPAEVEA
ncbi:MAG: SseB family protein, partial [Paracoccaceae bacterium]